MTPPAPDQAETIAFLTREAGAAPVETHISLLFLGPDTVWKLKKAVRLSFLDFTRVEDRKRFCERELELNAASAPGLYRDVVPVVRRPDGALAFGGAGETVDHVLRMARVPREDFIEVRAETGALSPALLAPALLDGIADAVAAFHQGLPPATDRAPDMTAVTEGNARAALDAGLPGDTVAAWREAMARGLAARAGWCADRAKAGFVRRGHGDLHLGNLCLWRGKPTLFDALEFDETLATIDMAYDLAFLLMDLEHRLDRAAANRVLNRYVARTGDADLVRGLPVFLSLRAMIRAHVEARSGRGGQARSYLEAAARYLEPRPAAVIAIGGLPGTGKSTLARALAPALGAAPGALIPRSDEIRKRRHGVAPEHRLPKSAYAPAESAAVFAELAALARTAAEGGQAVIADATFMDPAHRTLIQRAAADAGVPFLGLWLTASRAVLEQRVAARAEGDARDASDATLEVLRATLRNDPGAGGWHEIDAEDAARALRRAQTLCAPILCGEANARQSCAPEG